MKPGESIQAAVDAVAEGGTVSVMPGTYEETHDGTAAVRITKNGIKLIGKSTKNKKVILVPHAGQDNGIVVEPAVDGQRINGVKIQGFTVQGFPNNGIFTRYVDNFTIQKNESIDNLENGIWPTLSANGLVKKNVAYGSLDSALWVEGSENVRVLNNDLHHSPTGLEITVSKEITAQKNEVHHNTVGIGLYHPAAAGLAPGTPGLPPYSENGPWHIVSNHVHDNNEPNTAPAGSLAAAAAVRWRHLGPGRRQRRCSEEPDREQRLLRGCRGRLLPGTWRIGFDCRRVRRHCRARRRTTIRSSRTSWPTTTAPRRTGPSRPSQRT